jgi:hypothetical protein
MSSSRVTRPATAIAAPAPTAVKTRRLPFKSGLARHSAPVAGKSAKLPSETEKSKASSAARKTVGVKRPRDGDNDDYKRRSKRVKTDKSSSRSPLAAASGESDRADSSDVAAAEVKKPVGGCSICNSGMELAGGGCFCSTGLEQEARASRAEEPSWDYGNRCPNTRCQRSKIKDDRKTDICDSCTAYCKERELALQSHQPKYVQCKINTCSAWFCTEAEGTGFGCCDRHSDFGKADAQDHRAINSESKCFECLEPFDVEEAGAHHGRCVACSCAFNTRRYFRASGKLESDDQLNEDEMRYRSGSFRGSSFLSFFYAPSSKSAAEPTAQPSPGVEAEDGE